LIIRTIIFDLDDTLLVQVDTDEKILLKVAEPIARQYEIASQRLAQAVWQHAERIYNEAPMVAYCDAIGISATECLWGAFAGEAAPLKALARWAKVYRHECWFRALVDVGIANRALAEELAARFMQERGACHIVFPEVEEGLKALLERYQLALLTNGAADMQREKIARSRLEPYFKTIVISGEAGIGKPDPQVFRLALAPLAAQPSEAVMVGDSLFRDIHGAQQTGIKAIWVNRRGMSEPETTIIPDAQITSLTQLPAVIRELAS
jgi:putative hydrolase of the HAD superfamily